MRSIILWLFLFFVSALLYMCVAGDAHAADADKKPHFGMSTALGGFGAAIIDYNYPDAHPLKKWAGATALALIPGVIKEATDDHFDWQDMKYNVLGAATGSAFVYTITWRW